MASRKLAPAAHKMTNPRVPTHTVNSPSVGDAYPLDPRTSADQDGNAEQAQKRGARQSAASRGRKKR